MKCNSSVPWFTNNLDGLTVKGNDSLGVLTRTGNQIHGSDTKSVTMNTNHFFNLLVGTFTVMICHPC